MNILRRIPTLLGFVAGWRERTLVRRIRRASKRLDPFDAIANLSLAVTPLNDQTEGTPDTDRLMALPELAALIFAEGQGRPVVGDVRRSRALLTMHTLIPEALFAANMRAMFSLLHAARKGNQPGRVTPRLTHAAISRELLLRLPRFHDKEIELLKELFTGEARQSLNDRLGFGAEEIFVVYESLNSHVAQTAVDRIRAAAEELNAQIAESPGLLAYLEAHPQGIDDAKAHIATVHGFSDFGSAVAFTFDQLLERTKLPEASLGALLERLTIDLDAENTGLVKRFLRGDNPMRTRPFVSRTNTDGLREWLLVQPTWLIFGMRELFEIELSAKPMDQSYMKRRGELLERRGMLALVEALRPDKALINVEYVDGQHKRFETDGLILVGHVAIVLEAKSNRMTPVARSGSAERLWLELGPIVTKAAEQAERLRTLIFEGSSLHIRSACSLGTDGTLEQTQTNWDLDVSGITDVFTIALSLEDLNFIATITAELVDSGLIPLEAPAPWIVNVHDLEITAELLSRPSELVHFLSRRRRAAQKSTILANDELDYVMHYITMGLYTDNAGDTTEMIVNLNEELDAWYFYKIGQQSIEAPKPSQPLAPDVVSTLDLLSRHRPYGWLQASLNLLELDVPLRDQIGGAPKRLRATTRKDRQVHSMYQEITPPVGERFGLVAMSFPVGETRKSIEAQFLQYARLRQYASELGPLSAFGAWQGSEAAFDVFLHLDNEWEFDPKLEDAVVTLGLRRSGGKSSA